MVISPRSGISLAFLCLGLLGAMPILSNARPAGSDGLSFAIWLTFWQLLGALPLFLAERRRVALPLRRAWRGRSGIVAVATGAMFGLSTYLYVVTAERAGPVSMVIALQAYPLFAILWETLFLGRRKSGAELFFTLLMIGALVYLTTGGSFRPAEVSWWTVLALGIPLLWSVAHILLKRVLDTSPVTPSQVTVSRLAISGASLLLLQAALGEPGALLAGLGDLAFQQAALVMGVAYYLELILWFHAVRHIEVSLASSITVPAPAVTMLLAVGLLGDEVRTYQILAMGVVALAMYGLLLAGRRRARAANPEQESLHGAQSLKEKSERV